MAEKRQNTRLYQKQHFACSPAMSNEVILQRKVLASCENLILKGLAVLSIHKRALFTVKNVVKF